MSLPRPTTVIAAASVLAFGIVSCGEHLDHPATLASSSIGGHATNPDAGETGGTGGSTGGTGGSTGGTGGALPSDCGFDPEQAHIVGEFGVHNFVMGEVLAPVTAPDKVCYALPSDDIVLLRPDGSVVYRRGILGDATVAVMKREAIAWEDSVWSWYSPIDPETNDVDLPTPRVRGRAGLLRSGLRRIRQAGLQLHRVRRRNHRLV